MWNISDNYWYICYIIKETFCVHFIFLGKILIACSSAVLDFKAIIENIGGENEKSRADALLSTVEVVPDVPFTALNPSGQIKRRSLVIFGTGDHHRAVTLTANKGFVFASKQKVLLFFLNSVRLLILKWLKRGNV